ncbi:hypothetical protein BGZ83_006776 [Gryganskiella cystojenkinii]|nr:hypothetical protein BGZ83_006776 [Gryganskiella cystojenkinii]
MFSTTTRSILLKSRTAHAISSARLISTSRQVVVVPVMRRAVVQCRHEQGQQQQQQQRSFVSVSRVSFAGVDVDKHVQTITDQFIEARDELEYAEEARGSVYYNDDKETARQAVQQCLDTYDNLLKELDNDQKLDVQRKIGLKIMELKSQLDALNAEELE